MSKHSRKINLIIDKELQECYDFDNKMFSFAAGLVVAVCIGKLNNRNIKVI